jgi:hypothetical protein
VSLAREIRQAGAAAWHLFRKMGTCYLLLQITLNDFDQVFCRQRTRWVRLSQRIDDLRPDVVFQDFRHKAVNGASGAGDEPQQVGTSDVLLKCTFNGFDLTANPAHAVHHFGLFPICIQHALLPCQACCRSDVYRLLRRHPPAARPRFVPLTGAIKLSSPETDLKPS